MSALCVFRHRKARSDGILVDAGRSWKEVRESLGRKLRLDRRGKSGRRQQASVRSGLVGYRGRGKESLLDDDLVRMGETIVVERVPQGRDLGSIDPIELPLHEMFVGRDRADNFVGKKKNNTVDKLRTSSEIEDTNQLRHAFSRTSRSSRRSSSGSGSGGSLRDLDFITDLRCRMKDARDELYGEMKKP
eukprot:CAMPEP_0197531780 /NCGR_PEP_ID=MMETSP1318-20131121/37092_1 /TAXON_ID=552666 /ORGANISM="Partenskyella glossopodia, Strain RCC365" /LENGTH=188 /DNA_ID=CAMNT_0043088117 /DNA_START=21 /DNA_END=584 /DNA_ORIENTATION=+